MAEPSRRGDSDGNGKREPFSSQERSLLIMALGTLGLVVIMAGVSVVTLLAILFPPPIPEGGAGKAPTEASNDDRLDVPLPSDSTPAADSPTSVETPGA
ncbi:MAG TPA: hypothetical protein DCQ98_07045 [Planctomycetaceae bacterium]|nr:hypothetical protein [Planctomycetaceae bacterium]HRF02102.1 hypothetical protein [Pirellulaceae bacterium]